MAKLEQSREVDEAFYDGVIAALGVIRIFGEDVIFDEIVGTCDEEELVRVARKRGAMRWSGLDKWRKRR